MRHFALLLLSFCLLVSFAHAAEPKDDPFLVTAACDDVKSRATTIRLLDYVHRVFRKYHRVKPIHDSVTFDDAYEDGPKVEMHEATFRTFQANFETGKDGKKILWNLSTRSREFPLPFGLKFGQTMAEVQMRLGPPSALSSDTFLYSTGGEVISDVFFRFERNQLAEVSWNQGMAH